MGYEQPPIPKNEITPKGINMRNSHEKDDQPIGHEIQLFENFSKGNQRFIITLLACLMTRESTDRLLCDLVDSTLKLDRGKMGPALSYAIKQCYLANNQRENNVVLVLCSFIKNKMAQYCRGKDEQRKGSTPEVTTPVDYIQIKEGQIKEEHWETLAEVGTILEQALEVLCKNTVEDVEEDLTLVLDYADLMQCNAEEELVALSAQQPVQLAEANNDNPLTVSGDPVNKNVMSALNLGC